MLSAASGWVGSGVRRAQRALMVERREKERENGRLSHEQSGFGIPLHREGGKDIQMCVWFVLVVLIVGVRLVGMGGGLWGEFRLTLTGWSLVRALGGG